MASLIVSYLQFQFHKGDIRILAQKFVNSRVCPVGPRRSGTVPSPDVSQAETELRIRYVAFSDLSFRDALSVAIPYLVQRNH